MNLNQHASEIVPGVKPGARYARRMADPEDDRGEAVAWYFRMLIRQRIEQGQTQVQIGELLGVSKGHVNQILGGTLGIGVPKLVAFAEAFGEKPGELLDKALAWWPVHGKKERARVLAERAAKAAKSASAAGDRVPDSAPRGGRSPAKRAG